MEEDLIVLPVDGDGKVDADDFKDLVARVEDGSYTDVMREIGIDDANKMLKLVSDPTQGRTAISLIQNVVNGLTHNPEQDKYDLGVAAFNATILPVTLNCETGEIRNLSGTGWMYSSPPYLILAFETTVENLTAAFLAKKAEYPEGERRMYMINTWAGGNAVTVASCYTGAVEYPAITTEFFDAIELSTYTSADAAIAAINAARDTTFSAWLTANSSYHEIPAEVSNEVYQVWYTYNAAIKVFRNWAPRPR